MYYVYILELNNGKYYCGSTSNIEKRFINHRNGCVESTKKYRPLKLLYYRSYDTKEQGTSKERNLKKQKRREAIQRFMDGK